MKINSHCEKIVAILAISIAAIVLYSPFLKNEIVFDDHSFFLGLSIYDYAQKPFSFSSRQFPYFTLGVIHVLSGNIECNRIFNIIIHISCSYLIFLIIRKLISDVEKIKIIKSNSEKKFDKNWCVAFVGAIFFVLHPIAVYSVGYLAQRTILLATLFSLFSIIFFRQIFVSNKSINIIFSGVFFALAVFSKEHAIMLPISIIPLAFLYKNKVNSRYLWKCVFLYLAICSPAILITISSKIELVSSAYEPDANLIINQMQSFIPLVSESWGQWFVSAIIQTGLFFNYFFIWLYPDLNIISADIRIDFVKLWSSWWLFPKFFFFLISPIVAFLFILRKNKFSMFFLGFLYCWFLFISELVVVRFQEPFVLYRSYLWAPGYMLMIASIMLNFSKEMIWMFLILVIFVFFSISIDRLKSFETESKLWKDAAEKLTSPSMVGGERILYNRGRAFLKEKKYAEAISDFSNVIEKKGDIYPAYYNRALSYFSIGKYLDAMNDLNDVLRISPKNSAAYYMRGVVLEKNGCIYSARKSYLVSQSLGHTLAGIKLRDIDQKNIESDSVARKVEEDWQFVSSFCEPTS